MNVDQSILSRTPAAKIEFDTLMQDTRLAQLHDDACRWHREKISHLKSEGDWLQFHAFLNTINRTGEAPVNRDQLLQEMAEE